MRETLKTVLITIFVALSLIIGFPAFLLGFITRTAVRAFKFGMQKQDDLENMV